MSLCRSRKEGFMVTSYNQWVNPLRRVSVRFPLNMGGLIEEFRVKISVLVWEMLTPCAVRPYRGVCPLLGFLLRISPKSQGGQKSP